MKGGQLTKNEMMKGQTEINEWFEQLPSKASGVLKQLELKIRQIESFVLLSNISFYNHMHDAENYTDFRGDRMFTISELIALICLKGDYNSSCTVSNSNFQVLLKEIQELGWEYFGLMTMAEIRVSDPIEDNKIPGIAFRNRRDETIIRNPALPEHHLMLSQELYKALNKEIVEHFGFSIIESIKIREGIVKLIDFKWRQAKADTEQKALKMIMEVSKYRSAGIINEKGLLSKEELTELNQLSRKMIKDSCFYHCINEMHFDFGKTYCFTAEELASFISLDVKIIENFFKQFSCGFPSLQKDDQIYGPNNILKSKPLITHNGKILVPSMPLLTWCVEPIVEDFFKSSQKLSDKFKTIKHDYLLKKGIDCFSRLFGGKIEIFTNLYYFDNDSLDNRFETDGIFMYKRTLFIIEAKGHRISQAAKEGKVKRTQKHLEEIVRHSYEQGMRTYDFIKSKSLAEFITENKKKILFKKEDIDDVVIVSLVLEPIGNLTPLIRATNELGYFHNGIFPWIISIYDLLVIADHFDFPFLLPHYIKRRKAFLNEEIMAVFEEIDLMACYLSNRLFIEGMLKDADRNGGKVRSVFIDNQTDAINNYYMHKYKLGEDNPPKMELKLPTSFLRIIQSLDILNCNDNQIIMHYLLDMSPNSVAKFCKNIERMQKEFKKDGKPHDCSIATYIGGIFIGFSYFIGGSQCEVNENLYLYCMSKKEQVATDIWIGLGDVEFSPGELEIQTAFIIENNRLIN